jgi:hypothetical protein
MKKDNYGYEKSNKEIAKETIFYVVAIGIVCAIVILGGHYLGLWNAF